MSTVTPRWFLVNANGTIANIGYDAQVLSIAHRQGIKVVPLFNNAGGNAAVLLNPTSRAAAVRNVVHMVKKDHLDGVNIDFELIPASSRSGLTAFITSLAKQLHPLHKIVAVSVFPLVGVPVSINGAYNYRALSRAANELVIMTYDHHYSGGPPGPVAPWAWVKSNIVAALHLVPASHLVLAIGMYGYDWVDNGKPGTAPTIPDALVSHYVAKYKVKPRYNPNDSQNSFTYTSTSGVKHIVYYMGNRSAAARLSLAQHYHLAGIALWRLGYEQTGFWRKIP